MLRNLKALGVLTLLMILASMALAQPAPRSTVDLTPEQFLRHLYFNQDRDSLILEGQALATKKDASPETRSWFLTSAMQNSDLGHTLPLYTWLTDLVKSAPDDPWTLVTRATAADTVSDKIALCEQALAKSSRPEILLLSFDSFGSYIQPEEKETFKAFLEEHRAALEATADGLVAEANALRLLMSREKFDRQELIALYDRALKLDPHNVRVILGKVNLDLTFNRKYKEAEVITKDALTWAGDSVSIHQAYLGVLGDLGLSDEELTRRTEADLTELLQKRAPGPYRMSSLLGSLWSKAPARAKAMDELLIKLYPDSQAADMARVDLALAKQKEFPSGVDLPAKACNEVARNLIAFMERPGKKCWYAENRSGNGLTDLLVTKGGDDVDPQLLLAAAKAVRSDFGPALAVASLDRKASFTEVAQLAVSRIGAVLEAAKERSSQWRLPANATSESRELWRAVAGWNDVLGWADLKRGRIEEAGQRLTLAANLSDRDLNTFLHLGKYYQAKNDYEQASKYFDRALAAFYVGEKEDPAIQAFRELYIQQHGGKEGLDTYIAAVYERDRARRKPLVLRERMPRPESIPAFALKTLDGKTVTSDDLKGKVVVINFWGTWCGPCRREMPEFQKLWEKYKNDPQVMIVTIDDDPTPETAKPFLAQQKYTFPVLWRDQYLTKANLSAFPTTWFLNREGQKEFQKVGATQDLVAEFSWRIEALRVERPSTSQ